MQSHISALREADSAELGTESLSTRTLAVHGLRRPGFGRVIEVIMLHK